MILQGSKDSTSYSPKMELFDDPFGEPLLFTSMRYHGSTRTSHWLKNLTESTWEKNVQHSSKNKYYITFEEEHIKISQNIKN